MKTLLLSCLVLVLASCSTYPVPKCDRYPTGDSHWIRNYELRTINGIQLPCVERMRDIVTNEPIYMLHIMTQTGQLESMEVKP
jgi:hypothetical protein